MDKIKRNFKEFETASFEKWKEAAEASLKGLKYEKLFTKTYEGIELKPIYNPDDTENLKHMENSLPGFYPFVRSSEASGHTAKPWRICQNIPLPAPELFNEAARYDTERGQTALSATIGALSYMTDITQDFPVHCAVRGLTMSNIDDFEAAFGGINLDDIPLYLESGSRAPAIAAIFKIYCERNNIDIKKIKGGITFDPLMKLATHGSMELDAKSMASQIKQYVLWADDNIPGMKTIGVDTSPWHNAGANAAQELGIAMATAAEYMRTLDDMYANTAAAKFRFTFAIGSNFFMEIAKLRAARMLWAKIAGEFGADKENSKMNIYAKTSFRNKSRLDSYVNMLRATGETLAAVIGGADDVHTAPFDEVFGLPNKFSRRIARNTQLVIREEAHFADTTDPAGGAWYPENLTAELAEKAWDIFRDIEKSGGMLRSIISGKPQADVKEVFESRMKNLRKRKDVMVGTNKYPNMNEKPVNPLLFEEERFIKTRRNNIETHIKNRDSAKCGTALSDLSAAVEKGEMMPKAVEAAENGALLGELADAMKQGSTECDMIKITRFSEVFEELRHKANDYEVRNGQPASAFLANFGNLSDYKARADFSADFLRVGGLDIEPTKGFDKIEDAAKAYFETGHPVVVICSSDDKYPEIVPEFARLVKKGKPLATIVLAGYPKDNIEKFKEAGVDEFIHIRADIYDILSRLQNKIGM